MQLLDVATVHQGNGQWMQGWEATARACATDLAFADPCESDDQREIINSSDESVKYKVTPFGIVATMEFPVNCASPDDEGWLDKAIQSENELSLTRALYVPVTSGTSENWVGAAGVTEVAYGTGGFPLADSTVKARETWISQVMGGKPDGHPIMHVSPYAAPGLVRDGVLAILDKGPVSVFGDPVVIGDGYLEGPPVWFSGPVDVYLSTAQIFGIPSGRNNRVSWGANQIAAIDIAPCMIVRVGGVTPAP